MAQRHDLRRREIRGHPGRGRKHVGPAARGRSRHRRKLCVPSGWHGLSGDRACRRGGLSEPRNAVSRSLAWHAAAARRMGSGPRLCHHPHRLARARHGARRGHTGEPSGTGAARPVREPGPGRAAAAPARRWDPGGHHGRGYLSGRGGRVGCRHAAGRTCPGRASDRPTLARSRGHASRRRRSRLMNGSGEFVFAPLGGVGEIGMNLSIYGLGPERSRTWIAVDFGVSFGGEEDLPGIDLVLPDIRFLVEERRNLVGIVLTHAHEDHFGALLDLWPQLRVPVYATPFTAALLDAKRRGEPGAPEIPVRVVALTTFASNVARIRSAATAAAAAGREVVVVGRAMERVVQVARETGYLEGIQNFRGADLYGHFPPDKVLALCTGSQGEPRAALARIANDDHPLVTLNKGDSV